MGRKLKFSSGTDLKFRGEKSTKDKILEFAHTHAVKLVVAAVIIAGVVASVFIFMNGDEKDTVSKSGKTITLEKSDINYIGIVQPEAFNALASNDADIYYVNQIIYSQLFTLDDHMNLKPDLVDNYTADAENASVYITLRGDAKFSDGTPVTASDVKATVKYINSAGKNSPYYNYASKIESVSAEGEKNLVIKFSSAADAALDNLLFPIVSADNYSKGENFVLGSGPYAYESYDQGKAVHLKVNEYYYGKKAENKLDLCVLPAENQLIGLMSMDAVTVAMSRDPDAEETAEEKDLGCESVVSGELEFIGFNHANPVLKDKKVRQAIAHSIETDAVIEDSYGDSAVKTNSLYFPDFLGVKGGGIKFDQKLSAENLKKAGYKDKNKDGLLEKPDGEALTVKLMVNGADKKRSDAADVIKENMKAIGINIEIERVSAEDFTKRLKAGSFEMYLGGIRIDRQFNLTDMFGEYNYGKYADANVISKVAGLERALNADDQKKAFEQAQKALNEEIPYVPLCYKKYYILTAPTYKSDEKGTFFDCYRGVPSAEWKKTVAKEEKKDKE